MAERRAVRAAASTLDRVFAPVRAQLDALGVDLPVDALYREETFIGRRRNVICIAPHGGGIEPWTRFLARWVQERVSCDYWSAWAEFRLLLDAGLGIDTVDPTCKMLHVTSHRIWRQPELYGALQQLLAERTQPYALAVAVHGKADDGPETHAIEIGGTSPLGHDLRDALADHGFRARLGTGSRAGRHPWNIVNLIGRTSVQIEIPRTYRRNPIVGHAVVQALCDVLTRAA